MRINLNDPSQFTLQGISELLAAGSDDEECQLRVNREGQAWLSQETGNAQLDGVLFRLETWSPGAGCVGPDAARDKGWVRQIFNVLKKNWPNPTDTYIDIY